MNLDFVTSVSLSFALSHVRKDDIYRGLREEIYCRLNRVILYMLSIYIYTCNSIDVTEIGKTFPAWFKHRL